MAKRARARISPAKRTTCHTSAGSFWIGKKVPDRITVHVHCGGKAACGGGNALDPKSRRKTIAAVTGFVKELGWSDRVQKVLQAQLGKMKLSGDPIKHAVGLQKYHAGLGIKHQRYVITHLEKGKTDIVLETGDWSRPEHEAQSENVACADARHVVDVKRGKKQAAQDPKKGFAFKSGKVEKSTSNERYTIAGIGPKDVKALLRKAEAGRELTDLEKHNLAAVALSSYYFIVHEWEGYNRLRNQLKK